MTRAPAPAGYEDLAAVLDAALQQAAVGKGAERHAGGQPFDAQPMAEISRMVGIGFPAGQMMKKAQEAVGMAARGDTGAAIRELLGAINYAAGAVIVLGGTERAADGALALSGYGEARQPVPGVHGAKNGVVQE